MDLNAACQPAHCGHFDAVRQLFRLTDKARAFLYETRAAKVGAKR